MKKLKLITHNDLDGVGCYILLQYYLGHIYDIDVSYCTYKNVEDVMSETILNLDKYEQVYMTDISVTEDYFNQFFTPEVAKKIHIFDHHKTALYLSQYEIATVEVEKNEVLQCGTLLFNEYLKSLEESKNPNKLIEEFVEKVRAWDTWDWFEKDFMAKDINSLLYIKGFESFCKDILKILEEGGSLLSNVDLLLLKYENDKKDKYLKSKNEELFFTDIKGFYVGIVFADQYISELGNYLCNERPEIDFVAIIGHKSISYRTVKYDVDVSKIAQLYGGGGHVKASGSVIPRKIQEKYIEMLFSRDSQ